MKKNLEKTTVRDISYLINSSCLRANEDTSLETLADMLCVSDRYKVYLENNERRLCGMIHAKQIAKKILELSRSKEDESEMLPTIAYVLGFHSGKDLAEPPVTVHPDTSLTQVLELMDQNHIREIAVVDENCNLVGILEAKNILSHYLHAKTEISL